MKALKSLSPIKLVFGVLLIYTILLLEVSYSHADDATPSQTSLLELLDKNNYDGLKQYGTKAIDPLLDAYEHSDNARKTQIAQGLYVLSLKSDRARDVLLRDVHTPDSNLRLQVQWALGRVSNDDVVVKTLLDNMQNDPNPLFRDKAACALANDQVHLTERQHALLLEGLVTALEDEKDDVRRIALLALQIQTGQTKDFNPAASWPVRKLQIQRWKSWIEEYKKNISGDI